MAAHAERSRVLRMVCSSQPVFVCCLLPAKRLAASNGCIWQRVDVCVKASAACLMAARVFRQDVRLGAGRGLSHI
jgi:hypothetical protein